MGKTAFEAEEARVGFNLCLEGLLLDETLRGVYRPIDHTLRDWMHTLCSDGVANSICGETIHVLIKHGFALSVIREFMAEVTLPSKHGKTHQEWLRDSRVKANNLTSFATTLLSVVPILYLFMCQFCADIPDLTDVFEFVTLMHVVLGILASGPEKPMEHVEALKKLIPQLHAKFVQCFDKLKPKIHHMHHIIDAMEWVGKLLSCFVTERRHRAVKDAALHVMRYMEHTVLKDVINQMCEQMVNGHDLFKKVFLVTPCECKGQSDILTSKKAILECGDVAHNDVVFFEDFSCGRVCAFYEISEIVFVEVAMMRMVDGDNSIRDDSSHDLCFKEAKLVVDACMWHSTERPGLIKVCVPPVLMFKDLCGV